MFDHERLEVYRFAVKFDEFVGRLGAGKSHRSLRDQLDRASVSVMACIAEGAGRRTPSEKRNFYAMARGSATECAAHLDAMKHRNAIDEAMRHEGKTLLLSIVRMLSKLSLPEPT